MSAPDHSPRKAPCDLCDMIAAMLDTLRDQLVSRVTQKAAARGIALDARGFNEDVLSAMLTWWTRQSLAACEQDPRPVIAAMFNMIEQESERVRYGNSLQEVSDATHCDNRRPHRVRQRRRPDA